MKMIATIIGKDFVKDVEVEGSLPVDMIMQKLQSDWPGCHIEFSRDGMPDTFDYAEIGYFTDKELNVGEENE